MDGSKETTKTREPLNVALRYLIVAALWILLSDGVLSMFVHDTAAMAWFSLLKGWLFVAATAWLLYFLMSRSVDRLEKAGETLKASEEKYRFLAEHMGDVLWVTDLTTRRITYVSPSVEHLRGFTVDEVMRGTADRTMTPDSWKRIEAGLADRISRFSKGDPEAAASVDEIEQTCKDGSTVFTEVHTNFVKNASGGIDVVGVSRDITARKRAETALTEKHAEMERFVYNVSHDLRSPLITIKTYLGYLDQDLSGSDVARVREDMDYVNGAADKMKQMLDELLELSRVGRLSNPPEEVTFGQVAREAAALVAGPASKKGVRVDLAQVPVTFFGDRPRLVAIWQNLIENSVKFMGDEPSPHVEVGAEGTGIETIFFVRDNGIGVEPEYREKMFGLFQRFNPGTGGTGLGLALVNRIVALYGGRVWAESEGSGHGTTVRFTLPEAVKR